jgi:hypothetical protein
MLFVQKVHKNNINIFNPEENNIRIHIFCLHNATFYFNFVMELSSVKGIINFVVHTHILNTEILMAHEVSNIN